MAIEKIVNLQVNDNLPKTEKAAKSLREELKRAQLEVATLSDKFGATSREAIEAAKRAADLKDRIGDAQALTEAFNPDAKFRALSSSLAGVAGGYTAISGLTTMLGAENTELEKQLLKVQSAMAFSSGLQQLGESIDSFKQLGAVVKSTSLFQKAYNFIMGERAVLTKAATVQTSLQTSVTAAATVATGGATLAMKALRIALISTGIGAIVVGVGLLIANFEKISGWVGKLTEKFGGWRNVLALISPPIWLIIKALEAMGILESEAEEKSRKADEAKAKRKLELAKQLEKDAAALGDYYDFEIEKAKAAGASVVELEKKKRDALIQTALAWNENMKALIFSDKATQDQIKAWNENQKVITNLRREQIVSDISVAKEAADKAKEIRDEANKKAAEAEKKRHEEALAAAKRNHEQLLQELKDFNAKIMQAEQDDWQRGFDARVEKDSFLKDWLGQTDSQKLEDEITKGRAILDAAQASEWERLQFETEAIDRRTALRLSKEKEYNDAVIAAQKFQIEAQQKFEDEKYNIANQSVALLSSLAGKNKAIAKLMLLTEKGLAIAQIITNTSRAIAQATANLAATPAVIGVVPNPMYAVQAAATAKGITMSKISAGISIAAILAQTIEGLGGSSNSSGAPSGGDGSAGSAPSPPQFNIVGQNSNNQLAQSINNQQNQPVEAFVVSTSVTNRQQLDRQIRQTATFN